MPSLFTKIIQREIPAHIVYEDDRVIAFLDIFPVADGHTLVVPKHEKPNALASDSNDLADCWRVIQTLAPAILRATGTEGCVVVTNVGEAAGQSVPHTHFHIIPRRKGDGLPAWPNPPVDQDRLARTAEQIKQAL
ncbi:HIT family protein [Candidatus Parcubacteria bacterium]|nr:HIT family protein [Candidatus Parcubacteria bacterium]